LARKKLVNQYIRSSKFVIFAEKESLNY